MAPIILQKLHSRLFAKDPPADVRQKLADCLEKDSAHIVPFSSGGHVGVIQEALELVSISHPEFQLPTIAGAEIKATQYGGTTAACVLAYKRRFNIRRDGQGLDNIVGRMTISQLDIHLQAVDLKSKPPEAPPSSPNKRLLVVPFAEAQPFLISRILDNPNEDDLEDNDRDPILPSTAAGFVALAIYQRFRLVDTFSLQTICGLELTGAGRLIGIELMTDFFLNTSRRATITKPIGGRISEDVKQSTEFQQENNNIKAQITKAFANQSAAENRIDYHILGENHGSIQSELLGFGGTARLHALGHFKGVSVFLKALSIDAPTRKYQAKLRYEFIDHFGINDDDLTNKTSVGAFKFDAHGSPGQVAFWVLQHKKHPGNEPFRVSIIVEETVEDKF